ncbi:MAG: nucleotidyltransferase domain-containing protein [Proteobacteria bacterium]|nr:nucleotidyltransferase domain-containing protein [Pseudomonadota bacterium]
MQVTESLLKEMTLKIVNEVNPCKVILFGSHVRGAAVNDSDLDFLVIEDGPFNAQRSRRSEMTRLWKLFGSYRISKDFLVYTPEEIDKCSAGGNHVVSHAIKEGRVLYERA